MKLINTLLVLALGLTCSISSAQLKSVAMTHSVESTKQNLNSKQIELLKFAHAVAIQDGHKYPHYVLGIMMQESKAGIDTKSRIPGNNCYGVGQIKLTAAKAVLQAFPTMWSLLNNKSDGELQKRLIYDDRFNIRVLSKYSLLMGINSNPNKGITAYNRGLGGARLVNPNTWGYTLAVKQKANGLKNITSEGTMIKLVDDKRTSLESINVNAP